LFLFFFQAEDGIRDFHVTGVQTCALPISYEHALGLADANRLTFVHPYDDPDVIAGQGTIGMEILRQHAGPLDAIFVPIGGGGLKIGRASCRERGWSSGAAGSAEADGADET